MLTERSKLSRADVRRTDLISAATRAIRQHGVDHVHMRDVARDAGVSTGILYYYFRNKRELIYHCQDHALDVLIELCNLAYTKEEPRDRLDALIASHVRVVMELGATLNVSLADLPKPLQRKLAAKRERYHAMVTNLVFVGQASHKFRDGETRLRTQILFSAMDDVARWYRPSEDYAPGIQRVLDTFRTQLLQGLEC